MAMKFIAMLCYFIGAQLLRKNENKIKENLENRDKLENVKNVEKTNNPHEDLQIESSL